MLLNATDLDRRRYVELERRIRTRARNRRQSWVLAIYVLVLLVVIGAIGVSVGRIHE